MNVRELALVSALQAVLDVADGEEHPKLQSIAAFARRVLEGPGALEVDEAPRAPRASSPPADGAKAPSKATLRWRRWNDKRLGRNVGEAVGSGSPNALESVGSGVGEALANGATNAPASLFSSSGSGEMAHKNTRETEASERENQGDQDKIPTGGRASAGATNAQPTRRQRAEPTHDHGRVVAAFVEEYVACRRVKPTLDGKQLGAAKKLLVGRTADEAIAIIRRAFTDPFVAGKKPDLAYIASNVNAYQGTVPDAASGVHPVAPAARGAPPEPVPFTPTADVRAAMQEFFTDKDATGGTNGRR